MGVTGVYSVISKFVHLADLLGIVFVSVEITSFDSNFSPQILRFCFFLCVNYVVLY